MMDGLAFPATDLLQRLKMLAMGQQGADFGESLGVPSGSTADLEQRAADAPSDLGGALQRNAQQREFQLPDTTISSPRVQDLQRRADAIPPTGMTAPSNWKQALLQTLTRVAPVAIAGLVGGTPAASGAAQGTELGLEKTRKLNLDERTRLQGEAEKERGREEQQRIFQAGQEEKAREFDQRQQGIDLQRKILMGSKRSAPAVTQFGDRMKQWNPDTQQWDDAGPAPSKDQKPDNPEQQFVDEYQRKHPGSSVADAQRAYKLNQHLPGEGDAGSWQMVEDADGKPVLFNSKTGQSRPAPQNVFPKGTKSKADALNQKYVEPVTAAQQYAKDYLDRGTYTGAGDEALMDKFFDLAKPSSGFRMSQPQQDMLKNSQGWFNSAEAKFRHATTGTWFSDEQRKQIVATMNDLAAAKQGKKTFTLEQPSGGQNVVQWERGPDGKPRPKAK